MRSRDASVSGQQVRQLPHSSGRLAGPALRRGFTIVELLIVIVVIAILAAISIAAYNGIQDRARTSAVMSAAKQVSDAVALYAVEHGDSYPSSLADVNIEDTDSTTYQYRALSSSTPATWCATVTVGNKSAYVSNTQTTPTEGACAGHGSGGVAAVTNLVLSPKNRGSSDHWFRSLGGGSVASGVSWGGRDDWSRVTFGVQNPIMRLYVNASDLQNGETYTASLLVANHGDEAISLQVDFSDQGYRGFTLAPNESRRVHATGSRSSYDNIYRFIDIAPTGASASAQRSVLIADVMLTHGEVLHPYADGDSPNWVWNGTPHASTSTGPPL